MSTCINTSLDCFLERTVTLDVELTITCWFIVSVTALFNGLTTEMMPSLHALRIYIMHDCINCL